MFVTAMIAASLAGSPAPVALHCNPNPSKALGCVRGDHAARADRIKRTATAPDCHSNPGKSNACMGGRPAQHHPATQVAVNEALPEV